MLLLAGLPLLGNPLLANVAVANEARSDIEINLSPGSLQQALNELARAAQLQILYDPALVRGCSTVGVKGSMTPAQALEKLLGPTEVSFKFTANDAVALYGKCHSSPDGAQPQPSPERPAGATQPQLITVTAGRPAQDGYNIDSSLTAMKVEGPALVAPVAFQSLSQQVLRDRQAARLEDILEDVSSVESAPDGLSTLGFSIRGFPTYQYYIDGVRVSPDLHNDGFRDLANVDHIDVVKGPASTVYGRTEPGGLINVVTKQPLPRAHLSVEQQAGAFGRRRTQLDAGGPWSSAGSVRYRFNAAYESGGSFRELLSNRRFFLSPVVSWTPSPESQTTAYLEYLRSDDPTDAGLPVIGNRLPPVHVGRRVEDGGEIRTTDLRVGLRGSYTLTERWSVRYHLDSRWLQTPQSPQLALADNGLDPASCTPSHCLIDQQLFAVPVSRGHTYFASMDLLGSPSWGMQHSLLFGAEYFHVHGYNEMLISDQTSTVDLFVSRHQPVPRTFLQSPDSAFAVTSVEQWSGVYLQDHVALTEKLYLLAGARFDHVRESLDTAFGFPLVSSGADSRRDNAFKRRAGIAWHPTAPLSAYANYTENFGIATGLYGNGAGGTGTLLPAQSAREWEVGLKAELLGGRAAGSAAWYNLTEVNIAQPASSPLLSAQGFRTVTGTARSRGLELDVHGEILPNLQLMVSYAYVDSRIVQDLAARTSSDGDPGPPPGNVGNRLYGVPRHGGSLWLAYRFPTGSIEGLKLGIGVVARAERAGDNANDYRLPGFAKWRMLAAYGWHAAGTRFNLQLNVDNAFNARYFESLSGNYAVMPGCPRRWLVSLRAEL